MPHYMFQASYTPEAWSALVRKPHNRLEMVRKAIEKMGGKVTGAWFCFGEHDVMLICELPNNVSAASFAVAAAAGGALKTNKTTPLLTGDEVVEVLKQASKTGYQPPK